MKKHVKSIHGHVNQAFLNCISNGFKLARLKRKAESSANGNDDENNGKKSQLTLNESFKNGPRFSQTNYENKVSRFKYCRIC